MEDVNPPVIISFEGIDGTGKTTQLQQLSLQLAQIGVSHIATQEFKGDQMRDTFRKMLMQDLSPSEELSLIGLARGYHMRTILSPAIQEGKLVLIDRFIDSTYAYQGGGRGISSSIIEFMEKNIWRTPKPKLTIYLDLEPKHTPNRDRFEQEDNYFFDRVRKVYLNRMDNHWLRIQETDQTKISEIILTRVLTLLGNEVKTQ